MAYITVLCDHHCDSPSLLSVIWQRVGRWGGWWYYLPTASHLLIIFVYVELYILYVRVCYLKKIAHGVKGFMIIFTLRCILEKWPLDSYNIERHGFLNGLYRCRRMSLTLASLSDRSNFRVHTMKHTGRLAAREINVQVVISTKFHLHSKQTEN